MYGIKISSAIAYNFLISYFVGYMKKREILFSLKLCSTATPNLPSKRIIYYIQLPSCGTLAFPS